MGLLMTPAVQQHVVRPSTYGAGFASNQHSLTRRCASGGDGSFASHDEIQAALDDERTTILDVRRYEEIVDSGFLKTYKPGDGTPHQWIHMPCMPNEAAGLEMTASHLLKDKSAPILVHCAAGKRAAKAKEVLESMGYTNVLNAGAFGDLQDYNEA